MIEFEQEASVHGGSLTLDQLQIGTWFVFDHDNDIWLVLNRNAICDSDTPCVSAPLEKLGARHEVVPTVNLRTAQICMFDPTSRIYHVVPTALTTSRFGSYDAKIHWRHAQRQGTPAKPTPTESMLVEALAWIKENAAIPGVSYTDLCKRAEATLDKHKKMAGAGD